MRFFASLMLLVLACVGCQTKPTPPAYAEMRAELRTVTLTDGISESEAQIIGQCYFVKNVGCGGFSGVRDDGSRWIVDGTFGFAGQPVHFYIDKHSGKIVSSFGPSYGNPFDIFP
jgi:hypothetical protein